MLRAYSTPPAVKRAAGDQPQQAKLKTVRPFFVAAIATGVALFSPDAWAQDYQSLSVGGPGGGSFSLRCAEGDYLVGLRARSGDWVDAVAPLCARWEDRTFLEPGLGPMQGGRTGSTFEIRCDQRSAITSLLVESAPNRYRNVALLLPACGLASNPARTTDRIGANQFGTSVSDRLARESTPEVGTSASVDYNWSIMPRCESGDLAVGIFGASGNYLDRIGLICAPRPLVRQSVTERVSGPVANSVPAPVPSRGNVTAGANTRVTPESPPSRVTAGSGLRVTPERQRPRQCIEGYTWRMARIPDPVCVTIDSHQLAQSENASAASRVDPNGAWGPASCLSGYVWREAFDGDTVCVTPPRREQVREENHQAPNFQAP